MMIRNWSTQKWGCHSLTVSIFWLANICIWVLWQYSSWQMEYVTSCPQVSNGHLDWQTLYGEKSNSHRPSTSDWAPVVSGVPQGTVLGPLLFSLYINDITSDIESEIRLFADDCVCYLEIKNVEDTVKLQKDIDWLGSWARKWGMRFQPVKCNMMQLMNKPTSKIQASYKLEGTVLENVESILV